MKEEVLCIYLLGALHCYQNFLLMFLLVNICFSCTRSSQRMRKYFSISSKPKKTVFFCFSTKTLNLLSQHFVIIRFLYFGVYRTDRDSYFRCSFYFVPLKPVLFQLELYIYLPPCCHTMRKQLHIECVACKKLRGKSFVIKIC
jgi:hypothetical protein